MLSVLENKEIEIAKLEDGTTWQNSYLIGCHETGEYALVDPSGKPDRIMEQLQDKNIRYVLMTHNHSDDATILYRLKSRLNVSVLGCDDDFDKYMITLDGKLRDGDFITVGKLQIRAIRTPGHTGGSTCYVAGSGVFSGDTLLKGGPGYTAAPLDFERIIRSLTDKVFVLPDDTAVYPAHGKTTTIGQEKKDFAVFSSRPTPAGKCGDVFWLGDSPLFGS